MKSPYVRDLKPNEVATAVFLVQAKEIRQKRTGEPYLSVQLADRTGEMDAKMWDNVAEVMDSFDRDDFIKVKGLLQLYNNRPQFTIHKLRPVGDHEIDFGDFFAASARDPEEMLTELRGIVAGVANSHLRGLLNAFLEDPEITERYKAAPAAKTIHHAYRGGLIEHVLSLCSLSKLAASHYKSVDLDLLIAGAVLHDIGKIHELSYERGFGYSAEGQLIGHIAIGIRMIAEKLRAFPDFPNELRNLVEHIVLSHHGQLEFGSPKVPVFPEALLFHYLDDLDSKMECMRVLIDKEPQAEGCFTGYSNSMGRVALRKSRYLDGKPPEARPTPPAIDFDAAEAAPVSNLNGGASHFPPPNHQPAPASSPFGSKLQQALNDERK